MTGKIRCTTCNGTHQVSREVAAASQRDSRNGRRGASFQTGSKNQARSRQQDRSSWPVDKRFGQLLQLHGQGQAIVSSDAGQEILGIYGSCRRLVVRLSPVPQASVRDKIRDLKQLRGRASSLHDRWVKANDHYKAFEEAFLLCEKFWTESPESLGESERTDGREREKDMRLALRLCETRALRLQKVDTVHLLREVESLKKKWKSLETNGEAILASLEATPRKKPKKPQPPTQETDLRLAKVVADVTPQVSPDPSLLPPERPLAPEPQTQGSSVSTRSPATKSNALRPEDEESPDTPQGSGSVVAAIVWAATILLLLAGAFHLGRRARIRDGMRIE